MFFVMTGFREIKCMLMAGDAMSDGEATEIAFMLMEHFGGLDRVDVLMGREAKDYEAVLSAARRVADGEPVQYVTGETVFRGLCFHVGEGVLIPRPETEELVELAVKCQPRRVLDIGTGSGCIAVSIAKSLPASTVRAIDVSERALGIAQGNAERNGVDVEFARKDILKDELEGVFDMVVSNPPYICDREAAEMARNVLEHEPHLALFVPDDDPLLFYRRIANVALPNLTDGGVLLFEINRLYGREVAAMLTGVGYERIEVIKDQFGNDRVVKAIKH